MITANRALTVLTPLAAAIMTAPVCADSDDRPTEQFIQALVRDFTPEHPDFGPQLEDGYGHYCGNVAETLSEDGKPVFTGAGYRVSREWRDRNNYQIAWCLYDPQMGDSAGERGDRDGGAITSAATFDQWFMTVPGVNLAGISTLRMESGLDGRYELSTHNFFPIDGELLGDDDSEHNYFFTVEIAADFTYREAEDQMLRFMGDDDLWVFIDGRLVVDLGGVAGNRNQIVELRRLKLEDGATYRLHIFHAERHQPKSQFHLSTNILFDQSNIYPSPSGAFD